MRHRILIYNLLLAFFLGIFGSCSTEKNTMMTRSYHNVTSRYNVFFNGNESYKRGIKKMEDSHEDDFTRILPIFLYGNTNTASAVAGDMERAIQKATKVITLHSITAKPEYKNGPESDKQKDFYAQSEYNKQVPGNYLLMGKAYLFRHDFFLAMETFKFIMTEYNYDEIIYETQIWIARTYCELKQYDEAKDVLDVLTGSQQFPEGLTTELYATQADLFMKQEDYESCIEPLTRAVENARKKQDKIRYSFILAQLHQKGAEQQKASEYYRQVIKMNPSYEISFNARINRAGVYTTGADNAKEIKDQLRKMLKDEKNAEFQDQIYYALGNVFFREGDLPEAISNYKLSSIYSVSNTRQKTTSCLTLADIYYKRKEYEMADQYYDSAMVFLNQEYPGYNEIVLKTKSLSILVENLQVVQMEDSLQMLAGMNEAERLAVIDSIIAKIQLEETLAREQERMEMQDQQFNRMALNESQRTGYSGEKEGNWYFYNQAAKGFGQPEFKMKWGNRPLADNWRRSNKTQVSFGMVTEEEVSDTSTAIAEKSKILSNKSREFYLKDIPLTDSMMEISNTRIIEGLYNAGTIYKNDLKDYERSKETYRELLNRYPGNVFTLSTYFNLYRLYEDEKDIASANIYKESIVREFPESQPAQLLTNPNYISELQARENEVNVFYQQTYDMYQNDDYFGVIRNSEIAFERFADDPVIPKFQLIRVLAIGKTQDIMVFAQELDSLSRSSADPEVAERAGAILAYIMDTDKEVKTETQKIKASELYRIDSVGEFYYGMFIWGSVDINQLKFEFINLNLDVFPNRTFNVVHEAMKDNEIVLLVSSFKDKGKAWEYYDIAFRNEKISGILKNAEYHRFIISAGNADILKQDKEANKYWLFFQQYYNRDEGN